MLGLVFDRQCLLVICGESLEILLAFRLFPGIPVADFFAQVWQFPHEGFKLNCELLAGETLGETFMNNLNCTHAMLIWRFIVDALYFD